METGHLFSEPDLLEAVQQELRVSVAAAPWPPALRSVVDDILSDGTRVFGGRLTSWALFPLCCCMAACGDWRPALPAAAASELYITALDLFDDVEDGDTSWPVERYGMPVVLNAATALLALAHAALRPPATGTAAAYRHAQDALWDGLLVATGGQHRDLASAGADPLPVEECLDIARRKGGALAEAACRAGAAFGTDDSVLIDRLGLLGRAIGLYGQIDNDMHDADNPERKSDVARRKQTIPISVARASVGNDDTIDWPEAVWQGGIQLAYALKHAELARAQEALEAAATICPDPDMARSVLSILLSPLAGANVETEP